QPPSSMPRSASVSSSLSASRGAMGIVTSSAATELSLISRDFARARTSNTVGVARKTGSGLPNISAATDAPRVRTSSASENTSAAGAHPFNAISSKTPEPEQEPRLVGIIKMLPASETPCSGWWTSMTRLVARSTPPQKLSASAAPSLVAATQLRDHAIDRLPGADSLEREFAQELRPHAARAHEFRREQRRALEILAHRLDARG